MSEEIIQTRAVQDAMRGWNKQSTENEQPSSADEADVKSEDEGFFVSASNEKKKNKSTLVHAKKKKKSDREIFDSFFLSDHPWEEHDEN